LNSPSWAEDALHAIRVLGLHGISIDPGFSRPVIETTDARVLELADLCEAESVPLMITLSVIAGPYVSDARPDGVDRLAEARPDLQIVLAHASWPYFAEAIAIAFRRPNLWLVPDMYMVGFAGARDMVEAANGILRDQILFGSAYPSAPVAECIEAYWRLGLEEGAAAALYYENAARLLGVRPDGWT
jgi:predicted TIM-barrel fold metal-dependent hydrolase